MTKEVNVGDWLSFQYHVWSRIPISKKLAAYYCPRCKHRKEHKHGYVTYCEFEPIDTCD